ncbi:dual specificity protein kinase zak2-like protein [Tanacetum coccineum]
MKKKHNIATHYDFNDKYSGEVQDIKTKDTLLVSKPTHEEILGENGVEMSMDDVYTVEARRPETVRVKKTVMMVEEEDDDDDVEVDSRADDFINKFRNDLKLQRILSIEGFVFRLFEKVEPA